MMDDAAGSFGASSTALAGRCIVPEVVQGTAIETPDVVGLSICMLDGARCVILESS